MYFRQITDSSLSQYAYLIGCQRTGEAIVIDPERDIDRYLRIAAEEDLRIVAVTETHIHADFLSGCREFAHRCGTRVYLSDEGDADWKYGWAADEGIDTVLIHDGDRFDVGNIEFGVRHTPGHTPEHVGFLVTDHGGGAGEPMGFASGDFVFVGALGRPDLLETAAGVVGAMEPSARRLFGSVQGFLDYPDALQVWPGHGAGSACGKSLGAVPMSTAGYEKRNSIAIQAAREGEDAFVKFILEGQPEPPPYFANMKRLNKVGPPLLGELPDPPRFDAKQVAAAIADESTIVLDCRIDRDAYLAGSLAGSIYAPINKSFPTVTGSYLQPDDAIVLIVDVQSRARAITELIRIGFDRIVGWAPTTVLGELDLVATKSVGFDEMKAACGTGGFLLDVRRATEFDEGHFDGALNISHTRLIPRIADLPGGDPVVLYCRTGARAASAQSVLARMGRSVVLVDDDIEGRV